MAEQYSNEPKQRRTPTQRYPWRIGRLLLVLLCPKHCQGGATQEKYAKEDYLYNSMLREDSLPVIDYVPPRNNQTKNLSGGSELYHPSFLYSTSGPALVPRVVEFYA